MTGPVTNDLLWVAVPSGLRSGTEASIRVLMVPRLEGDHIDSYGLQDWPSTLADQVVFSLHTKPPTDRAGTGSQRAAREPTYVGGARPEVWTGFFGGDAANIRPYQNRTNPVPAVGKTSQLAAEVNSDYRDVTRVGAVPADDVDTAVRNKLRKWAAPEPDSPLAGGGGPFIAPDFHAAVSMLREHPHVLIEAGLVFELTVDIADLDLGDPETVGQLSIGCEAPNFLRSLVTSPWTYYQLDRTAPNRGFWPASPSGSTSAVRRGMLDLAGVQTIPPSGLPDTTRWAISTFDVDGVVGNLRQTGRDIVADNHVVATMPPMRSTGLALLKPKRAADFAARVQSAASRAARDMADTAFGAEDLVLGYHVDIKRDSGDWQSLCQRYARYTVDGDVVIGDAQASAGGYVLEEGHVKPFPAVKDAGGQLHADELVLRWDGWSLAMPRPDLLGDTNGSRRQAGATMPYDFDFDFHIKPESLPALRFTSLYAMRVRIADMAGGGRGLDDPGDDLETKEVIYRRHEPIPPPRLGATGEFSPGAAIDRLVIRSDENMTALQLEAAEGYPHTDSRTLDAPIASLQLIEQHGELDDLDDDESFALALQAMHGDADGTGVPDPATDAVNALIRKEPGGLAQDLNRDDSWGTWPEYPQKTIKLTEHTGEQPVTMTWRDDTLNVGLRRAEQATILVSSRIRANYEDHLAAWQYLVDSPAKPLEDTRSGRNPLVTPPRAVLVVHAVRKPLLAPRWKSPLMVDRVEGDTSIVLRPDFHPGGGAVQPQLDTDSTGRLDLEASWIEFEDTDPDEASTGERPVTVKHVHSQSIDRGDPPDMRIGHEFGNTKHRWVTYTLHATSRFREYFKPSDPESAFLRSQTQEPVNVECSVRPSAPVVLGVVPAFRWQREEDDSHIEHHRQSGRLRVELARPWLQTGEGEQLAVVLAPAPDSLAAAADLVTRVGRDPLFGTPATPAYPTPDWFTRPYRGGVPLPEANSSVTIVPIDVVPDGDRWYADIEFSGVPGRFYNPLIQLAVARYQSDTIEELSPLSPVVITDRVPLLPDRRVTVTRSGNEITIAVAGTSPQPLNHLEVILESGAPELLTEKLDLAVEDPAAEPLLPVWRPVPGAKVTRNAANGTIPKLTLPAAPGRRLRLRLRETEDRLGEAVGTSPADLRRRNVFVDTIVLPPNWQPA